MVGEQKTEWILGSVATSIFWFIFVTTSRSQVYLEMSGVGWTPRRRFFPCFRFQLIKQGMVFLLVNTQTCLMWVLAPAGGRGAGLCLGTADGCAYSYTDGPACNSYSSYGADTRTFSSAAGCVIYDVFLAVQPVGNITFINLILWWRQVRWEILCLGRIHLGGF